MSAEPSKAYSPVGIEARIYQQWLDSGAFHADPADPRRPDPFSMVIPPPNVTGALHLGHAINNTLQDIIVRRKRMQGFNTLWMPGVDHAGIATQAVVEKQIFEKEKKTRHDLGREELVKRIWAWKEQYGSRIVQQLKLMGCSCDWQRNRFTLDELCARAVREWFFRLFKDGLIFRGKRLVNWDTHLQTAVADDEVYHETVKGSLCHIRYPIIWGGGGMRNAECGMRNAVTDHDHLIVATTRPETMLADTAVAVHPEDERYKHLIGKQVVLPLTGRTIPVIADSVLVKREFGTGCVKVTPGHDPNDYACYQRNPSIGIRNMMTPDGRVNDENAGEGGKYAGMKLDAARKQVVADLETAGLVEKVEPYETQVGHSDRSKVPIQPYLSDQWFVKMGDVEGGVTLGGGHTATGLAQAAIDAVCDDDEHYESPDARKRCDMVHIFPRRYVNTYRDWLAEKRDWCISRQLWWGHRIPVWTREYQHQNTAMDIGETYAISGDFDLSGCVEFATRIAEQTVRQFVCPSSTIPAPRPTVSAFPNVDFNPSGENAFRANSEHDLFAEFENEGFVQDPDVLDTWFSSALWPLSTMGWPNQGISGQSISSQSTSDQSRDRKGAVVEASASSQPFDLGDNADGSPIPGQSRDRKGAVVAASASSQPSDLGANAAGSPIAYFLTFHTHGTWQRGNKKGSVDRRQNEFGTPTLTADEIRERHEDERMTGELVLLDEHRRPIVEATLREVAEHRGWKIHALNVRSNHVHVVVSGDSAPEKMLNDFKSYATRRMVERGVFPAETRAWSRHGSTRYIWDEASAEEVCKYVVERQGDDLPGTDSALLASTAPPLPDGRGSEVHSTEPEPGLLATFYPTTVLSTAREIITLWVARMVIAGLYNVGRVPFRDVVIHPVIQDGQGRQMKKSLGNGVDPVDIIDMYGADALRFTLAGIATETQDVRIPVKKAKLPDGREVNASEKFETGRNFCNKLWQAATGYILPNVADVEIKLFDGSRHTQARPQDLPLFDRWIRTRLNHCIAAMDEALDAYKFSRAAEIIRDFFWTEVCDWYLEESKIRVRGPDANDVKIVLLEVLDTTLCVLHPFIPYITEALWEEVGKRVPRHYELLLSDEETERLFAGIRFETPPLIRAPWPKSYEPFRAEMCDRQIGDILQPIITALRQAKTDINVARAMAKQPAIKALPRAFLRADAATCDVVRSNIDLIKRLGAADGFEFGEGTPKPPRSRSHVDARFQLYIPQEELIDLAMERARLEKELLEKRASLDRAQAQLANEGFVSRASPDAVQQARDRAAELERQCALIRQHVAEFE